jgi:ABC-type proline/glycine betaine transport system ATPase subunit
MTVKIKVENLSKIFGKNPKNVLEKLEHGVSKEKILQETRTIIPKSRLSSSTTAIGYLFFVAIGINS